MLHPTTRRRLPRGAPALLGLPTVAMAQSGVPSLRVHRAPSCGCCEGWAEHLRQAGFTVTLEDAPNLDAVRRGAGVPDAFAECHIGLLGDRIAVEGHVPAMALRRFLADPAGWRELAVPGMPLGSPGMEMPGAVPEAYTVFAFAADGRRATFVTAQGDQAI